MKLIELGSKISLKGKAGNLNRLYHEFNIVRGFVIPNSLFLEFLEYNKINLSDENIDEEIMNGKFIYERKLIKYFKDNKYDEVIVRSSASVEDGNKYSFAGQFESFREVNEVNLIRSIKKCWLSMVGDNICEYMGNLERLKFDVLIQEMVISDMAGIAFSIDPTSGEDKILIEVTDRQCEDLVSGKVKPKECDSNKRKVIEDNLNKLKKIFNREVEIEFAFKNNEFYLFQVRPITKVYYSLEEHIKNTFWCSFKNNDWTLFNRTLWIMGATKYKNKNILNEVTEDITIYYPNLERQVRGFNGSEAPLSEETINKHKIEDINKYIKEDRMIIEKINKLSLVIKNNIEKDDFNSFKNNLRKLIKLNALVNSYEYLIGSLAQAKIDDLDYVTLDNFNKWRNSEDTYFMIYDDIFSYLHDYFQLKISNKLFFNLVTCDELIKLCEEKILAGTIEKRVLKRLDKGFVLLNVHNKRYANKVILNKKVMDLVKNKFMLDTNIEDEYGIKGKATFKLDKVIKGECVVIKNNQTLKDIDLDNKILVCEITTSRDVKYLKKIKALVVDNGGILCHSAIFSREFNIPCLMGCEVATKCFKTGDMVEIDLGCEVVKRIED